jgi:isoleucyl-tRNA synthetase
MYQKVSTDMNFVARELETLAFWKKNKVFEKSVALRKGAPTYTFFDGPPTANGKPHIGHVLTRSIKDLIPRYKTMKGYDVLRKAGWDTHGLPVELEVEKSLGLDGKEQIEAYGVEPFIKACKESVWKYEGQWEEMSDRVGFWCDMKDPYVTYHDNYIESEWWALKTIYEKGLLYKGHKIVPYCPRCGTALSSHEVAQGYHDVKETSAIAKFRLKDGSGAQFLAWTTTPWTLPSNLGLTMGPDIDYVKVHDGDEYYILAESRLHAYYKDPSKCEIVWKKKGAELIDTRYEPLFPYFADLYKPNDGKDGTEPHNGAFRVFNADFVSTEDGTGIVHTAPGFGEDDNKVFKGTGIPTICPVDNECKFTAEVSDYQGRFVKDCDKDVMDRLKKEGKLVKRDQILHAYPFCWRCSSPLIYRAVGSWFVRVEKFRDEMVAVNQKITWQPEHLKNGRFGKWLEGARDWAISRNRYWGNPIPVWQCPDCGESVCVGSRKELEKLSGVYPEDLHKHFVDKITIPCKCGGTMHRIPEVLDCWFESGSMPYAQQHYPFENKEYFEKHFPAKFISEGLDQTRGWFYTLTVLATALFDKPAFENVVVNGLVLASDGKKMSKSLRNFPDPRGLIEQW